MPRRVLITGASRGIGKAIAEVYKREGWETLTPTREQLCLGDEKSQNIYFRNRKNIDALICNAAVNVDSILETLRINTVGNYDLIYRTLEIMKTQSWGRIVCLSSCSALLGRGEHRTAYSASKSAVDAMVRCLASSYSKSNLLVNSVCPGFVDTDMTNQNLSFTEQQDIKRQIPIGRFAKPEEIAEFVYFLGSEKNTYITGQVVPIDGGYTTCR